MIRRSRGRKYLLMALGLALATTSVGLAAYVVDKSHIETDVPVESDERVVCYNKYNGKYYTSIEKAFSDSTQGDIYVIPELTNDDGSLYEIHIKEDLTISYPMNLVLPYSGTTYYSADEHGSYATAGAYFADQTEDLVKQNMKTNVIVDPGVTVTIHGSNLIIGGVLGNPTQVVAGNTAGAYAQITLSDGASIVCEDTNSGSPSIECYGYIKRTSNDNGSKVVLSSKASFVTPFVIYDYKGGTATLAINNLADGNKFCPFQIFDFPNVQTLVRVNSGATWQVLTCIYIQNLDEYYPEDDSDRRFYFIKSEATDTSSAMFLLTSGYMEFDYRPTVNGITTNGTNASKTYIKLVGEASVGSIALSFTYLTANVSIDSSNFFLPISYKFDLTVANGSTFKLSKKVKLMNGSSLLVENGATMNVTSSMIVYDDFEETTDGDTLPSPYPSGLGSASFINNGTVNVTSTGGLGGYISTTAEGGKINLDKNASYNVSSPEYGGTLPNFIGAAAGSACSIKLVSASAKGSLVSSDGTSAADGYIVAGIYDSVVNPSDSTKFAWKVETFVALTDVTLEVTYNKPSTSVGSCYIQCTVEPTNASVDTYKWTINRTKEKDNVYIYQGSTESRVNIWNDTSNAVETTATVTVTDKLGNSKTKSITVSVAGKKSCLLPTAKVLMADGTYKEAGSIKTGDMVVSFNHETGKFEPNVVIGNDHRTEEAGICDVAKLVFSNGKSTEFITEHGYFDKDLNKYVYLHTNDYTNYVGHEFVFYDNGKISTAKLISGSVTQMYTTVCSPATANHLNLVVDDMLTVAGGLDGLFNIFDYNPETLAFDDIKKREDIDRYGLLGYESFEKYFPEEIYNLLPCKYLNVSIGKGLLTWETFEGYVLKWKDQLLENL